MSDDATSDPTPSLSDWEALAAKDLKGRAPGELTRTRPEGIDVKPLYTAADTEGLETDTLPGRLSTGTPARCSIRSVWSRVGIGSSTVVTPTSVNSPANSTADLTWAEAIGTR